MTLQLQRRVSFACPDCGQRYNTTEDYPGWKECIQCGRAIFWRDVKDATTPEAPRTLIDDDDEDDDDSLPRTYETLAEMLDVWLAPKTHFLHLAFAVGKYGRQDLFCLRHVQVPEDGRANAIVTTVGKFDCWTPEESIAALHVLDDLTATHPEVIFSTYVWSRIGNKASHPEWFNANCAAALYRRRIHEQERILAGTLKRGHRAFGFYPLEGHA